MAEKKSVRVTNRKFFESDEYFIKACSEASVTPTKRQASKFRLGRGLAYKTLKGRKDE
jgi:predicted HicB family RNase H-like nuclease